MILRNKQNKQAVEVSDEFAEVLLQGGLFEKIPAPRAPRAPKAAVSTPPPATPAE